MYAISSPLPHSIAEGGTLIRWNCSFCTVIAARPGWAPSSRTPGLSLRGIAEETSLGVNTVRTIVDKRAGTDRTTRKHRARIEPDRQAMAAAKRQRPTADALPRRAQRVVEDGAKLIKEARGLGRT